MKKKVKVKVMIKTQTDSEKKYKGVLFLPNGKLITTKLCSSKNACIEEFYSNIISDPDGLRLIVITWAQVLMDITLEDLSNFPTNFLDIPLSEMLKSHILSEHVFEVGDESEKVGEHN